MSKNLGRDDIFYRLGHEKSDELLNVLKKLENVNFQDEEGTSYLHIACSSHYVDAISILLEKGADPNCNDKEGYSPILSAIGVLNDNNAAILDLMLKFGLNLDKLEGEITLKETIESFEDDELNKVIENHLTH